MTRPTRSVRTEVQFNAGKEPKVVRNIDNGEVVGKCALGHCLKAYYSVRTVKNPNSCFVNAWWVGVSLAVSPALSFRCSHL
jgi:hypothetical protein